MTFRHPTRPCGRPHAVCHAPAAARPAATRAQPGHDAGMARKIHLKLFEKRREMRAATALRPDEQWKTAKNKDRCQTPGNHVFTPCSPLLASRKLSLRGTITIHSRDDQIAIASRMDSYREATGIPANTKKGPTAMRSGLFHGQPTKRECRKTGVVAHPNHQNGGIGRRANAIVACRNTTFYDETS